MSWGIAASDDFAAGSSRVEFTLRPTATGTALSLLHVGLPDTRAGRHASGWGHYLGRLRPAAAGWDPGLDTWMPGLEPQTGQRR